MTSLKKTFRFTKLLLQIIFLESLLVFLALALQPSTPESRTILLYSLPRFAEMLIVLGAAGIALWGIKSQTKIQAFFKKEIALYSGISLLIISRLALVLLQAFAQSPDLGTLTGYAEHLRPLSFFFSLIGFEIALWALLLKTQDKIKLALWGIFSVLTIFSILLSVSPVIEWAFVGIWALATAILLHKLKEQSETTPLAPFATLVTTATLVTLAAFIFQISLQTMMRPYAVENFYFQKWSSETMMAAVPLKDLQNKPLETLAYVHTAPPGFAAIRAAFVHLWDDKDSLTALRHVDFLLYQFYALLYSIMGAVAFLWLQKKTNFSLALIGTFALLIHPATLLYATLLDSNFLTAFLVFLLYYLMWKVRNEEKVSNIAVIFVTLALFFTRSVFQYPFVLVIGVSLFLMGLRKKALGGFLFVTVAIVTLFGIQHYRTFGTISTSSFAGLNLNRSVGNPDFTNYWSIDVDYEPQDESLPKSLTRTRKTDGSPNYNHIQYLQYNTALIADFKNYFFAAPPSDLLQSYGENIDIYFQPSNIYHSEHAIADRVAWRKVYESIFSAPILPLLLLALGIFAGKKIVREEDYLPALGFILPALYIFTITVLFEKGENMRFKFFIEPLFFIFIVSQLYEIIAQRKNQTTQDKT